MGDGISEVYDKNEVFGSKFMIYRVMGCRGATSITFTYI
jgi:hypothetical protein